MRHTYLRAESLTLTLTLPHVLTFNLAYQESERQGGKWIHDRAQITRHYALSWWCVIDVVSVLPFFLVTLDHTDPWNVGKASAATVEDAPGNPPSPVSRASVLLRVVKLLRMLKLARLLKASRVMERHLKDVAQHRWEMTFAVIKVIKLSCLILVFAHFQACLYGLISSWLDAPNWITEFDAQYAENEAFTPGQPPHPLDRYVAALYWSIMTLTSIGYGEFTPVNSAERWVCSALMLASGMMWTYAIGSVAAIATTLNPDQVAHENLLDQLNYFMRD